jgi:magnesium chelatase family protein
MQYGIRSATLVGVDAHVVVVEIDLTGGLPMFTMVGLAEASVREAGVRVRAAIGNSGLVFPAAGRTSVNLAPASLRKAGTGFDLPIALGVLAAQGVFDGARLDKTLVLGELSLGGELRAVRGALAAAEAARQSGLERVVVAPGNAGEAALVPGVEVRAVRSLGDAVSWLRDGVDDAAPIAVARAEPASARPDLDLADVRGQPWARRALEVAAAGAHNLLLIGGPGAGKTMLARRLPSILPPLAHLEAMEVARIASAAGLWRGDALPRQRPFRAPHHSTSAAGLVGGGAGLPRPGDLSLAHRGVIFLDELPEFSRHTLEVLRQPLESGEVNLARAWGSVRFPARAQVVAAMNPCPCGFYGEAQRRCRCGPAQLARYRARVSGPLLDRLDLHVHVPPVELGALEGGEPGEASSVVRGRVLRARERQAARLGPGRANATMTDGEVRETVPLCAASRAQLARAMEGLMLSARGYDRAVRIARTIADLEGDERVGPQHVAEAVGYRQRVDEGLA